MAVFDDGSAVVSFNCEGTNEEDCFGAREASTGALDSGVPALQSIENTKDIFVAVVGSSGSFKLLLSAGSNESDYAQLWRPLPMVGCWLPSIFVIELAFSRLESAR
jgi:hypothetical protein